MNSKLLKTLTLSFSIFTLITTTSCASRLEAERVFIQEIKPDLVDKYLISTLNGIIIINHADCYKVSKKNDFYYELKINLNGHHVNKVANIVGWDPGFDFRVYYKYVEKELSVISAADYYTMIHPNSFEYIDLNISEKRPNVAKEFDE